jgi:hypothetical protein
MIGRAFDYTTLKDRQREMKKRMKKLWPKRRRGK